MSTTATFDERVRTFQQVAQLRAVAGRLEEMLSKMHRLAIAAEELAEAEGLADYSQPDRLKKTFGADLSEEIRERASVLATEMLEFGAPEIGGAAAAAQDFHDALELEEAKLYEALRDA